MGTLEPDAISNRDFTQDDGTIEIPLLVLKATAESPADALGVELEFDHARLANIFAEGADDFVDELCQDIVMVLMQIRAEAFQIRQSQKKIVTIDQVRRGL